MGTGYRGDWKWTEPASQCLICQGGVREREPGEWKGRTACCMCTVTHENTHTHGHRRTQSVQGDRGSAGVSVEFCLSVLLSAVSISQDAAEKEEFHFWSVRRVRANAVYQNISHSLFSSYSVLWSVIINNLSGYQLKSQWGDMITACLNANAL